MRVSPFLVMILVVSGLRIQAQDLTGPALYQLSFELSALSGDPEFPAIKNSGDPATDLRNYHSDLNIYRKGNREKYFEVCRKYADKHPADFKTMQADEFQDRIGCDGKILMAPPANVQDSESKPNPPPPSQRIMIR